MHLGNFFFTQLTPRATDFGKLHSNKTFPPGNTCFMKTVFSGLQIYSLTTIEIKQSQLDQFLYRQTKKQILKNISSQVFDLNETTCPGVHAPDHCSRCFEGLNGLSNFSNSISKYSRTSLYDPHQKTLKPRFTIISLFR